MASPINAPVNGDIWHLNIDDLLAPLPEIVRLGGPGPFVINLSTSTAPIGIPAKTPVDCQGAHVYLVQRTEDHRLRYRLRLGPIAGEDEADAVLQRVRDIYPSALTATADAEDLRAIAVLNAKAQVLELTAAHAPTALPARAPSPLPSSTATAAPTAPVSASLPSPTAVTAARNAPPAIPVLTSAAVRNEPRAIPVLTSAAVRNVPPAIPVLTSPAGVRSGSVPAPRVERLAQPLGALESTQTVRALSATEMQDELASRWFVIQLSLAEQAFDPETVPNLDIFSLYRLYCVAGIDQGRKVHALRLGFFSEQAAASAVASYLAAFYDKPTIKRVSTAERRRFTEQPLEPRKDVGATGKQAVIEITSERFVREKRGAQASAK